MRRLALVVASRCAAKMEGTKEGGFSSVGVTSQQQQQTSQSFQPVMGKICEEAGVDDSLSLSLSQGR